MINLILKEQVPNFKFVAVKFANSQHSYTYKTNLPNVNEGDFVVVDAPSGLTVVTVVDANVEVQPSPKYEIKWLVGRVDTPYYKGLKTMEQQLIAEHCAPKEGVDRL